jgi:hypothetical protein
MAARHALATQPQETQEAPARPVLREVESPWFTDPGNLADLWRWLEANGETPRDPATFLGAAERYGSEYLVMRATERVQAQLAA